MTQTEAQLRIVEEWRRQSQEYSSQSNDALVTSFARTFETISVALAQHSDNIRIGRAITSLDNERKLSLQFEKKNFDILRHLSFGLIESLQVLLEVKTKKNESQNQNLVDEAPNVELTIVEPKEEPVDSIDQILEENQLANVDDFMGEPLFKEEDIDFAVYANNDSLPMEKLSNDLPSIDKDFHEKTVHSDMMIDDINSMEDPIMDNHNSTPIEKETLNNLTSSAENVKKSAVTGMIDDSNPIEEKVENVLVHNITDTPKNSSEAGEVKIKKRPSRTQSRPVNYTESLDESEPPSKKPSAKSEKKIDNKRNTDIDDSSLKSSNKVARVTKINHTELKCPNCEYRSRSVSAWRIHLSTAHSVTPRELGLTLLCACGYESFTDEHSRKCAISKITIVRKNVTPKCVMCEVYPTTVYGYSGHLHYYHKTTLKKMGIFLICSCGYKLCSFHNDPEHTKKCNGHEYTLHKLDVE